MDMRIAADPFASSVVFYSPEERLRGWLSRQINASSFFVVRVVFVLVCLCRAAMIAPWLAVKEILRSILLVQTSSFRSHKDIAVPSSPATSRASTTLLSSDTDLNSRCHHQSTASFSSIFSAEQLELMKNADVEHTSFDGLPADPNDEDIIIVPSLSIDRDQLECVTGVTYYEERCLFALFYLQRPRTRVVYVTSIPIPRSTILYYLELLQRTKGVAVEDALSRLLLLSCHDWSHRSLTEKILERPRLIERVREFVRPGVSKMSCFVCTPLEKRLALLLRVPLHACDPSLDYWGSKAGSKEIFLEAGIPILMSTPLVKSASQLSTAILDLMRIPENLLVKRVVVKLNQGFSGKGNALLSLPVLDYASGEHFNEVLEALETLQFEAREETWDSFKCKISIIGALAEIWVESVISSPSVQGYISPAGQVSILSTHEQELKGQCYLGSWFPADNRYRNALQQYGRLVGESLAAKGAVDRFSVDFVVVQYENGDLGVFAVEINLRWGGTTHPMMTLDLLTDGRYDDQTGSYQCDDGSSKCYYATDNLQRDAFKGWTPTDITDLIDRYAQLQFNATSQTGIVFHMLGSVSEFGKVGLVVIANSVEDAQTMYKSAVDILEMESSKDLRQKRVYEL